MKENETKISFSFYELEGKTEEQIQKMIADKLASQERKTFFDYLMSFGEDNFDKQRENKQNVS